MIKRIYIKASSITNSIIGSLHYFLERRGILKQIPYSVFKRIEGTTQVKHNYPVNFIKHDEALFAHCTNYETNELIVYSLSDCHISTSGIVFKGFNNCWLSFPHTVFRAQYGWLYFIKHYWFKKNIHGNNEKTYVLLFDFWLAYNYYHWLVDALPRLLMVKDEIKQKNTSLLLPKNCPKFIMATLKYYDINEITFIEPNTYFTAKNILLPYYAAGSGHIHPAFVREVTQHFVQKISDKGANERIYVSRGRQKARRISNEIDVINLVALFGFKIVYYEDLSFEEQVSLAKGAKILVSSHGANMTNMMFMPSGSKVLELIREDKPNFCYWALASVTDKKYYYQLCKLVGNDHLMVEIKQLRVNLEKLVNE